MTSQDKETMNLIYYIEFQVKQSILDNKSIDELKPVYFEAQYNYLLIKHKLFPLFYEEACTPQEAFCIVNDSWETLVKEMNELKEIRDNKVYAY